ncbi:unnamed protein product [Clavelina lepadiformis]|uniref:Phospholipase A2 n=1 Tax=Clavelina lepadiformis TaxID=159417 RepID=A0ABP0F113_CLALP
MRTDLEDPFEGLGVTEKATTMYQAEVTSCIFLTVTVLRGRNIPKKDPFSKSDPYVKIYIKESPNACMKTRYIDNKKNPEWNQTFTFLLPNNLSEITAEFTLMDKDLKYDDSINTRKFDLSELAIGETVTKNFRFAEGSEVDVEFHTEISRETDLRLGTELCDKENDFRKARKQKVFHFMRELLQKHKKDGRPRTADEAPVIGVLGSGGGFRAMVGYAGVMKALHDTGILDCSMYVNGLSGSSWYLATLYANKTFPKHGPQETNNDIRSKIDGYILWTQFKDFLEHRNAVRLKQKSGQPTSYTDYFGRMCGQTLLGQEKLDTTNLSKFQDKIKEGAAPLPILTAIHVRPKEPANVFHDWVEFSPYEVGIAKYGSFIDSQNFGSKFFRGALAKIYDESPLHYLMGIWGSAYSKLFVDAQKDEDDECSSLAKRIILNILGIDVDQNNRYEISQKSNTRQATRRSQRKRKSQKDRTTNSGRCSKERHQFFRTQAVGKQQQVQRFRRARTELVDKGRLFLSSTKSTFAKDNKADTTSTQVQYVHGKIEKLRKRSHNLLKMEEKYIKMLRENPLADNNDDHDTDEDVISKDEIKVPTRPYYFRRNRQKRSNDDTTDEEVIPEKKKKMIESLPQVQLKSQRPSRDKLSHEGPSNNLRRQRQTTVASGNVKERNKKLKLTRKKGQEKSLAWFLNAVDDPQTRGRRTAKVFNYMRDVDLQSSNSKPTLPNTADTQDCFEKINEILDVNKSKIYVADAGLAFNSPYPPMLRAERGVDIILSFDFSAREKDDMDPLEELYRAEKWANLSGLPFPKISRDTYTKEGLKECYVFRDEENEKAPIVIHFVLCNINFRKYSAPGVKRKRGDDWGNFNIFPSTGQSPYSTFNFNYTNEQFDKLTQLMEFNTLLHIDNIVDQITHCIHRRQRQKRKLQTRCCK